jgi:hypothetical protein
MKTGRLLAFFAVIVQIIYSLPLPIYAEELPEAPNSSAYLSETLDNSVYQGLSFLVETQENDGSWGRYGKMQTADITDIIEYICINDYWSEDLSNLLDNASFYFFNEDILNVDDISKYLLINDLCNDAYIYILKEAQNPDGGFGLDKGYASDIIDTKLALKALADIGETEAMTKAALYIASLQNDDGGFAYQVGLDSNPELTAEIADILTDCVIEDQTLSYKLTGTIKKLGEYLDTYMVPMDELSADDLSGVYQHFYTALFKLKLNGVYDVTPYLELQNEDGGVFDDPMATALFLELIVREQNYVNAKWDYISITNDKGNSVSSFNANENVNIEIGNEYEADKAYMQVFIETPRGKTIQLDTQNLVWNTGDYEEGTYTVHAKFIRLSNDEIITSITQTFSIEHKLVIDGIVLALSQGFTRVGDEVTVSVSADVGLSNFSDEADSLMIRWNVKCNDESFFADERVITKADSSDKTIYLGDFTPDTSERKVYLITAEVLSNELVTAQSTTNFFVSDKSLAVISDVNKDFLYESSDDAEISVKIRDERVVDLILTTSSEDTTLISQYAEKIEGIKTKLESLGYIVNLCSVSTSYLTAKDTFAWNEYDHPNYNTQAPYTQHIIYDGDNIKMLGYTYAPYKDFLLVPDDNSSQKMFNFDMQRDKTDWHSMNGGGFLFNTIIENNLISGYYVLVTSNGLKLYSLDKVNLGNFRNSATTGTLLRTFPFANLYEEHHIKISADSHTISLWDGEKLIIDNYELPAIYGNGYGPITSHASHNCSQRSYFTFANITMQTITGEKLSDILENYNFESPNSRYVINLSDNFISNFSAEEEVGEVAQKIIDRDIIFIGLGNDKNEAQYQNLIDLITNQGLYYDFTIESTPNSLSDYVISTEESKRVKVDDQIIATELVFSGALFDRTIFTQTFDILCVGETLEIKIPTELTRLVAGTDAILLKNATLTYKDENSVSRTRNITDITLPVITPEGKISNSVTTDHPEYIPYQDVKIFDRIHNNSKDRTAKDLTNVIKVLNAGGEMIAEYTTTLPEIMPGGYVERQEVWNTSDYAAGTYTICSEIYSNDFLFARSTAIINVTISDIPTINLAGELVLSGKSFKVEDIITIDSTVGNVGHTDVTSGQAIIKIVDTAEDVIVYQYEAPLNLAVSETVTDTISVIPQVDFASNKGTEYLVIYEAVTEDGLVIPISSDGFLLGTNFDMIGNMVLFSTNTDTTQSGILMSGNLITVNGDLHSNTNIEANCSILTIANSCNSVISPVFNTWQTHIGKEAQLVDIIEVPDFIQSIRERLQSAIIIANEGWISDTDDQLRVYGNNVSVATDIYSDKSIVIDPSNFSSDNANGILICSEKDITIRSTDVNLKGVIYAPNGTVRIETSNFYLQGRIIAKNIIYQGNVFTGETYDGDLDLLR